MRAAKSKAIGHGVQHYLVGTAYDVKEVVGSNPARVILILFQSSFFLTAAHHSEQNCGTLVGKDFTRGKKKYL